jgi:Amt family ammonium transporter
MLQCLWFGWFGFNAGYTLKLTDGMWKTAALICVNTALSPAASVISVLAVEKYSAGYWNASAAMNGVVAGLVGITGPCGVVDPWASIVIGLVSGLVYSGGWRMHEKLQVDDPVHAIAVHAWPGAWGCIASGLFAVPKHVNFMGYNAREGLLYSGDAGQFGIQLLGVLVVLVWTVATSAACFGALHAAGLLRVSPEDEEVGVDVAEHGEPLLKYEQASPRAVEVEATSTKSSEVGGITDMPNVSSV